jgi:hypothetical protein
VVCVDKGVHKMIQNANQGAVGSRAALMWSPQLACGGKAALVALLR